MNLVQNTTAKWTQNIASKNKQAHKVEKFRFELDDLNGPFEQCKADGVIYINFIKH